MIHLITQGWLSSLPYMLTAHTAHRKLFLIQWHLSWTYSGVHLKAVWDRLLSVIYAYSQGFQCFSSGGCLRWNKWSIPLGGLTPTANHCLPYHYFFHIQEQILAQPWHHFQVHAASLKTYNQEKQAAVSCIPDATQVNKFKIGGSQWEKLKYGK